MIKQQDHLAGSESRQLIITGFHRSGTSMLAQALNRGGLFLGDNLMPPHPSNPDGHFEDLEIVNLHDAILEENRTSWKYDGARELQVSSRHIREINRLIKRFSEQSLLWGFKDPRTCLFLDHWVSNLSNPCAVIVYRDFHSCLRSLKFRQAMQLAYSSNPVDVELDFWHGDELPLKMWLAYNRRLIEFIRSKQCDVVLLSQEDLLSGAPVLTIVNDLLGLGLDEKAETAIRKSYEKNHIFPVVDVTSALMHELQDTLEELDTLSCVAQYRTAKSIHLTESAVSQSAATKLLQQQLTRVTGDCCHLEELKDTNSHASSSVENGRSDLEIAEMMIGSKEFDKAAKFLEKKFAGSGYDNRLLIKAGRVYYWLSDFCKAESYLLSASEQIPNNSNIAFHLGLVYLKTDKIDLSRKWLLRSLEIEPNKLNSMIALAENNIAAGKIDEADFWLNEAIVQHPNKVAPLIAKARLNLQIKSYDTCLNTIEQGLEQFPQDLSLMRLKVLCLHNAGRKEDARSLNYKIIALPLKGNRNYRNGLLKRISELESQRQQNAISTDVAKLLSKLPAGEQKSTFIKVVM